LHFQEFKIAESGIRSALSHPGQETPEVAGASLMGSSSLILRKEARPQIEWNYPDP
jgi:hypothetical protein